MAKEPEDLTDEALGLTPVQGLDQLDSEARTLVEQLLEDRRKIKGALVKERETATASQTNLRNEKFARLKTQYGWLKPEMLNGVAPEKWDDHVAMWAGAVTGQAPAGGQPPVPALGAGDGGEGDGGDPPPPPVIAPDVGQKIVDFFSSIAQNQGAPPAPSGMTFDEAEQKVADNELTKEQYQELANKGLIKGMPKTEFKGGKLIVGG